MSFYKTVTLTCDGKDCTEWYDYDRGSATEAREVAESDGWLHRGKFDYCPECAKRR